MSNDQFREGARRRPYEDDDYPSVRRITSRQQNKDREQLRLLAIFYYIAGGLLALMGLLYLLFGTLIFSGSLGAAQAPPPEEWNMFLMLFVCSGTLFETLGICVLVAARSLTQQKRYLFCFVIAFLLCLAGIPGILLGVFSMVVLARESVKELFARGPQAFSTDEDYE